MAKPPSFAKLRASFPYKSGVGGPVPAGGTTRTGKDLIEGIGGQLARSLKAIYPDLNAMNTCAVRLSYCLNYAGHSVTSLRGVRSYSGADGYRYTIAADEMITYLTSAFGTPVKIWDGNKAAGKQWLGTIKAPTQGIFGYDWQGRIADFGAGGHVDIGRLVDSGGLKITDIGTGSYFNQGPMIVYFWESPA
jgi:hypothetical protein